MRAKKQLGQHFLTDQSIVDRIINSILPSSSETILEIGAGLGALTSALIEKVGKLVAVEVDRDLTAVLQQRYGHQSNFKLVQESALTLDFREAISPSITARVVANLPYYISTAILQRLIKQRACITEMFLMLQREVVNRITAAPGSSERGYLSVLCQAYCETEVLFEVPPASFSPAPKVGSAVLRLGVKSAPTDISWDLVSLSFNHRRKTILNNLRVAPNNLSVSIEKAGGAVRLLEVSGVDPRRRAETLTLEEWADLSNSIRDRQVPVE